MAGVYFIPGTNLWIDEIELMILIEDEFAEVEISENDVTQIEVVGDLMRMLSS